MLVFLYGVQYGCTKTNIKIGVQYGCTKTNIKIEKGYIYAKFLHYTIYSLYIRVPNTINLVILLYCKILLSF